MWSAVVESIFWKKDFQTGYLGTLLLQMLQFYFLLHISQLLEAENTPFEVVDHLVFDGNNWSDFVSPL